MTDKIICPEDGLICDMTDEEKDGQGCWNCPKVRAVLDKINERKGEIVGGSET